MAVWGLPTLSIEYRTCKPNNLSLGRNKTKNTRLSYSRHMLECNLMLVGRVGSWLPSYLFIIARSQALSQFFRKFNAWMDNLLVLPITRRWSRGYIFTVLFPRKFNIFLTIYHVKYILDINP